MTAVLHMMLLGWAGVATTALLAPTLRPTARIAVGLGMSYAVALGASTALLLLSGPSSLAGLPYLLGSIALAASLALLRRRREPAGEHVHQSVWPSLAVACVALLMSLRANIVGSPAYNPYTLFYLTFGSNVAGPDASYPALWAYGNEYILPFMQLKYALMFPTLLWSGGDPIDFLHTGAPALCVLITTSVALTAFEFFRAHARGIPSALFAAIWLTGALDQKLYSIRAETIAWITAFSFLTVLTLALQGRSSRGLWVLCSALMVTTSLLHGIVFLVAGCIGTCIWLAVFLQVSPAQRVGLLRSTAASAGAAIVLLGVVYLGVHARHARGASESFVEMEGALPAAGNVDPTRRFHDLYTRTTLGETRAFVRETPPAVSLSENLSVVLTRPLLTPLRGASVRVNLLALGLGLLAAALLLARKPRKLPCPGLTAGFAATIAFLFTLSVVLNFRSTGWFPWAVVERRFLPYVSASEAMILAILVVTAAHAWASRPRRGHLLGVVLVVAASLIVASTLDTTIPRARNRYLSPHFADVTRYIRANAHLGDRAVSSWGSMGHMQYLTGIPHDSEGVMPYEVHRLIGQNVRSLERTRRFLDKPDRDYLDDTGVRYVVVTWRRRPPGTPFSHAPISEFEKLGRLVLRNDDYVVFDMKAQPATSEQEEVAVSPAIDQGSVARASSWGPGEKASESLWSAPA